MGNLVWYEWAHYLGLTSAAYALWAGFWGLFFRKFFWDMIGGTLGPAGIIPGPGSALFVAVIVQVPLVQILTMILSVVILMLELPPLKSMKESFVYRNFMFKASLYFGLAFLSVLFYQGINAAIYSLVTIFAYTGAQLKGEMMPEQKANKGRGKGSEA
ncbi:hypothetical protein DACRYDRAFT_25166 [Dacryopinax primogenitus]|uniref:DUF7727 domain-containing protein n=1 Tax=Dacryopinax primogenitus (strain DJM 731) TaxID=1858805 RepID=M5FR82_DACPD|nr:uncharacterized protein DACRYDRAFT_25166 [Dacryopinax primogenitus]EJT97409.1 hypothetical protein DACRYDRAFT_25166 [Dacryopinax primogenitus]